MINLDKRFTKKEFQELLRSKYGFLITNYYLKPDKDNGFYDYYVSNLHTLTKEEEKLKEEDRLEIFNILKAEELNKINNIANKATSPATNEKDFIKIKLDTLKSIIDMNEYFKSRKKDTDFCLMFGYWMGIYALSSYLTRVNSIERKDTIEDIINTDYSLFK